MLVALGLLRRIARELPRYGKLTYGLFRDPRVPQRNKVLLAAGLVAIFNPVIDIPLWIPVVGEMDALALTVLAVKLFVDRAPREVVREIEAEIAQGRSAFDRDLEGSRERARGRVSQWWQARRGGPL
ncbi:MAG TPA: hypothetical protein VET65_00770 [Candidatus Limnocylindrales bacterium]|nr:hypothetical protein [Candidatus Limnocylindrales bacterium]